MAVTAAPDPASYMTVVAATDAGRRYKAEAAELLGVAPGEVVADLGCGPGTDLEALGRAAGPAGRVLGIDADATMLAEAAGRGARLVRADLHALPLPPASVDRARTDRVLQHVRDPGQVLAEVARVLRPGGAAVFAEPDWTTLTIDSPVPEGTAVFRSYVVEHQVRNAAVGSALPRLAVAAGLSVSAVQACASVITDRPAADTILGLTRVSSRAIRAGAMTPQLAAAWLDSLAGEPFTAAVMMFLVRAGRPPA